MDERTQNRAASFNGWLFCTVAHAEEDGGPKRTALRESVIVAVTDGGENGCVITTDDGSNLTLVNTFDDVVGVLG